MAEGHLGTETARLINPVHMWVSDEGEVRFKRWMPFTDTTDHFVSNAHIIQVSEPDPETLGHYNAVVARMEEPTEEEQALLTASGLTNKVVH